MNRRDAFRGIVAGASVGLSGAAAEASFQPTVPFGPRLIRPNRGARLEAWLAENDRRSADVAIDWERGLIRVTLYERFADQGFGSNYDRWLFGDLTVTRSDSLVEDVPGSFTPEAAGVAALIERMHLGVVESRERYARKKAEHERRTAEADKWSVEEIIKFRNFYDFTIANSAPMNIKPLFTTA